ncbi:MAG TPA: dinitrogenase iron-molybdenum cofactor biosynthesis protein [Candidatus Competibacteraceae bacterium]|nr:dinitrogenase iron-molybdenum cofactor biosynthesis protein [Candidatus Competibacteraceae bacterium]
MTAARQLPRCVALRIALAARQLPDTTSGRLLSILLEALGEPLTEAKLNSLTVKDLKIAADGALRDMDGALLRQALSDLKGENETDHLAGIPQPQPYDDGEIPNSIRVACASNSGERLDGHFGSCARYLIYQVSAIEARLIAVRPAPVVARLSVDHSADRVALIEDCDLLCVLSIGGPAAARVVNSGVHPIKRSWPGDAQPVLDELQTVLAGDPPPWLARIIGRTVPSRVLAEAGEAT